jgi:hypothetical protein
VVINPTTSQNWENFKKCIYIYVNYELIISPISCTLYIFPHHLKKQNLKHANIFALKPNKPLVDERSTFFLSCLMKNHLTIQTLTTFFFFKFVQMKQIKN